MKLSSLIDLLIVFILLSCEIDTQFIDYSDKPPIEEFSIKLCYAVQSQNMKTNDFGLYIFDDSKTDSIQGASSDGVINLSQVSENNLFTCIQSGKPYLGNINGSISEIALPKSDNPEKEFFFLSPFITISPDGKKLIYFCAYDKVSSHSDSTSEYFLCIKNLDNQKTEKYSLTSFINQNIIGYPDGKAIPDGKFLITDFNGNKIYFVLETFFYDIKKYFLTSIVVMFDNKFNQISTKSNTSKINLIGINHNTERIFVEFTKDIYKFETNDFVNTHLKYNDLNSPFQFTYFTNELVIWKKAGISVINAENYETIIDLISYSKIDSLFGGYEYLPFQSLAFSPDRHFVAFILKNKTTGRYDLFLVSKAGSVVKRIGTNLPFGTISILSKQIR